MVFFAEWPAWVLRTFAVLLPIAGVLALSSKSETEDEKNSGQCGSTMAICTVHIIGGFVLFRDSIVF